jgi:hypothetical protein
VTASTVLALLALRHYGYYLFPCDLHAQAWNALGAIAVAVVLFLPRPRNGLPMLVALWWVVEEVMVVACSVAFSVAPWPVDPCQDQCSAWVGMDLALFGALIIAIAAWAALRSGRITR